MDDAVQKQLIAELGRGVVSDLAPQELPLFRANSELYFKDSQKALKGQAGKDEMLSFGVGEAVTFLTPFVLAISAPVVTFLIEEVKKSLKEQSSQLVAETVKKMFKKFRPEQDSAADKLLSPLTLEQVEQARKLAFERAIELGFSESKARSMAEAVMVNLVVVPD